MGRRAATSRSVFSLRRTSTSESGREQRFGASKCVEITKLAEGSFNKTFKLTMDNGLNAIARIPHPIAGPRFYMTASEVATMDFVRMILVFLISGLVCSNV